MKKITISNLIKKVINNSNFVADYRIYAKDGDNNFHIVDSIDIYDYKISCIDGWWQCFESFQEGHCQLFYEERQDLT